MSRAKRDAGKAGKELRRRVQRLYGALIFEAAGRIVMRTPVDTGRARGGWTISQQAGGVASPDTVDPKGSKALATARQVSRSADVRKPTWILNNVNYILRLEHGHSKQAPSGMVGLTVAELKGIGGILVRKAKQRG